MLRALEAFAYEGGMIVAREVVEDDHPAVEGRELYFERVDVEPAKPAPRKPRR